MKASWWKEHREDRAPADSWLTLASPNTRRAGLAQAPGWVTSNSSRASQVGASAHPWNLTDKDLNLHRAPTHCVAWGKSLNLSGLLFSHV